MRANVVQRWAEPGGFSRDVEIVARRAFAVMLVLGTLGGLLYWLATVEAPARAADEHAPSCESLGFPAAIPGSPAAVQWNGPIAFEYDGRARNAAWAMAVITPAVLEGSAVRRDRFMADHRVDAAWRATLADYEGSGFDRGHLLAASYFGSQADRDATFKLSNIAPQHPELNRGAWKQVEEGVREWVRSRKTAAIVVLPVYAQAVDQAVTVRTIGKSNVWVPERYAAAVLLLSGDKPVVMQGWLMPNSAEADEAKCRTSVDEVERAAGFDLFWRLPDEVEAKLEAADGA